MFYSLFVKKNEEDSTKQNESTACGTVGLLDQFVTPDGKQVYIYEDGKAYLLEGEKCSFATQYFEPDFLQDNYIFRNDSVFIREDNKAFPTKNNFLEDFESTPNFTALFIKDISDTDLYWTDFTLLSPATPTVTEYVSLRQKILKGEADFIDNKLELADDPVNNTNQVMKFTSVSPSAEMVTSKASISSIINYFTTGSDLWFEADYYIESGLPFSLVDFESGYFEESPGPRIVIRKNELNVENKFGAKINTLPTISSPIVQGEWFSIKCHFKFSSKNDGVIEVWKNDIQVINTLGINLPLTIAVQNSIEVGITASSEATVLFVDNIRVSDKPF